MLFRSHYGFDPFYCEPGISGAHEKGGVEGEIGRFRRNFLTPVPVVESLAELNRKIRAWDEGEDRRRIGNRISMVGQDFAAERPFLAPVPVKGFDPGLVLNPRVDRSALISVRTAKYSVPVRFIGRKVRSRCGRRRSRSLTAEHWLPLIRAPLPGAGSAFSWTTIWKYSA